MAARSDNTRSILAMLIAVAAFSLMDAVLKTLAGTYPPMQVAARHLFYVMRFL